MTLAWKRSLAVSLSFALLAPLAARSQAVPPPPPGQPPAPPPGQVQAEYSQAELDQMLAPIALYPDALLSQVLMAATYPLEVNEAAAWSRANAGLRGDAAVRAAETQGWDPSVTSLAAFPQILERMSENPEWTRSLGDAFLDQETQVMATVQQLRQRAQAAGNLQSTDQLQVQQQGQVIVLQAPPEAVYVPYYDPFAVYGPWWWPAYPPVAWNPWPGYARPRPGVHVSFWWGAPVAVSAGFFFGNVDWRQRHVRVVHANSFYYRPPAVVNRTVVVERGQWQHDPSHRRGVKYASPVVQQRFAHATPRWQDEKKREDHATPKREDKDNRHQVLSRPQAKQAEPPKPRAAAAPQAQRTTPPREQQAAEPRERRATPPQARQPAPPQPRAEHRPQPQPHAQQAPQPRAEPRPQQRAEPRPQPRAEPRSQAHVQQQAQPPRPQRQEANEERGDKGHKGRGPG